MCDCKIDWLWFRYPFEVMKYLFKCIFSFLRSGVEVKRGAVFRHLTRNVSKIRRKRSAYSAVYGIQRAVDIF